MFLSRLTLPCIAEHTIHIMSNQAKLQRKDIFDRRQNKRAVA